MGTFKLKGKCLIRQSNLSLYGITNNVHGISKSKAKNIICESLLFWDLSLPGGFEEQ